MELIPAIDLLAGKGVRLRQGRYDEVTVYSDDPAELAATWSGRAPRLHVVDLEGARQGRVVEVDLIRRMVQAFGAGVQVGGGVRSRETLESYLELGVERVVLGTAALNQSELLRDAANAHPGRVIVALDARAGRVATHGWLEQSERLALDVARELAHLPLAAVLYTDIERDGMETGPNIEHTARLARDGAIPVIASGGVATLEHLSLLARCPNVVGAIVGRALHENRFTLEQALDAARG